MTHTLPPALVVAGTKSGCGKTSVALGLMRALTRRGLTVAAFKAGPDFIDPGHHALASNRASHNLDDWMCGEKGVRDIFARWAAGADAAVIEGVMGLFDGLSATDEAGSTARLAKLLGLPVLLVVDAASMARSAAALTLGYVRFDPGLTFCGVILNNAGSPSHAALLAEALAVALPDVPVWGVLPRRHDIATPSRHLGLVTAEDAPDTAPRLDALADWLEAAIDLPARLAALPRATFPSPSDGLFDTASATQGASIPPHHPRPPHPGGPGGMIPPGGVQGQRPCQESPEGAAPLLAPGGFLSPRPCILAVARDQAFCFYYGENLRRLEAAGLELVPFSPLADTALPPGSDGLYLGGGYPEVHAAALSGNAAMRRAVQDFCRTGRPVYAECGGFMYLLESLTDLDGRPWPMAGVFPAMAAMGPRFAALGYREVTTRAGTLLGPAGTVLRGHEFHYSRLTHAPTGVAAVYGVTGRKGVLDAPEGFVSGGTLGSYVHLHFGSNPDAAVHFAAACAAAR
ncbi:cobyrinate a,c-diamide synthase [Desulfovibrio sp. TomC]|uniref:cobyrinate a,c-diamide synthase n=1 Tax=Desulfovibrio sp. TomC TaxID=1562888 RepID=UPI000573240F|nr:cobyrinate a,c-diamide synthase [Desulfovibrio sp. TomC]KHK03175.1 Cobyrinic acid A,C-diamide synthase [Desulfovibrio sp. TomC]